MQYHNRRIGDRRSFAVEFEFDLDQPANDIWGCLWLWAGGRCIGNSYDLEIVDFGLSALVQAGSGDHTSVSTLSMLPAKDALDLVMWAIYGDDDAERERNLGRDRRWFERFEVLPGLTGAFFDDWQAVLIDSGADERFIVRHSQQATFEFIWASGTFRKVVGEARDAFGKCVGVNRGLTGVNRGLTGTDDIIFETGCSNGGNYAICYSYDSNGNLTGKTANRGLSIGYSYDR